MLYAELLDRLPELCDHPESLPRRCGPTRTPPWRRARRRSPRARWSINEVPDLDLAVVEVPESAPDRRRPPLRRPVGLGAAPDGGAQRHRARRAAHDARPTLRIRRTATRAGCSSVRGPYGPGSTWPRSADAASEAEADAGGHAVVGRRPSRRRSRPRCSVQAGEESGLSLAVVRALVEAHLRSAPPAWDPYASPAEVGRVGRSAGSAGEPVRGNGAEANGYRLGPCPATLVCSRPPCSRPAPSAWPPAAPRRRRPARRSTTTHPAAAADTTVSAPGGSALVGIEPIPPADRSPAGIAGHGADGHRPGGGATHPARKRRPDHRARGRSPRRATASPSSTCWPPTRRAR